MAELELVSDSPAQTRELGAALGALLQPGDVVLLHGELGAGKTHLAQGVAAGLGITEPVRSPTFILVNEYYEGRIPLFHMDLYRLEGDAALASVGLDDFFEGAGVVVVEWPERGVGWLPDEALHVTLSHAGDERRVLRLHALGAEAIARLAAFWDGEGKRLRAKATEIGNW